MAPCSSLESRGYTFAGDEKTGRRAAYSHLGAASTRSVGSRGRHTPRESKKDSPLHLALIVGVYELLPTGVGDVEDVHGSVFHRRDLCQANVEQETVQRTSQRVEQPHSVSGVHLDDGEGVGGGVLHDDPRLG